MATRAEFWANQLATNATVYGSAPCNLVHGDTSGVGQNLAMYGGGGDVYKPYQGVNLWVNEGKDYDYALFNPFSSDPAIAASGCRTGSWSGCGHWTQVRGHPGKEEAICQKATSEHVACCSSHSVHCSFLLMLQMYK